MRSLSTLPLRLRLVAAVVLLSALALALSGAAATASLRGYLLGRVDVQLGQAVDRLAGQPLLGGPTGHDPLGSVFAEVITPTGTSATGLHAGVTAPVLPSRLPTVPFTSGHWRVEARTTPAATVIVALPLDDVEATVSRLVLLECAVGGGVLLLLGGLGYVVVRRSLKPLVEVETTAEAIAGGDLSRRVPESDPRTEVGSLGRSFNTMLDQVESAFAERAASEAAARASEERMRRFVGDASHELRTPLTSIRGFAELYRQGAVTDVGRTMSRVEAEATRMGGLVDDLLQLARLDLQRPMERTPVDLVALATDAVHDAQAADPGRPVSLHSDDATCEVEGDRHRLTQVLANLLANARVHTPAGTPVHVRLSVDGPSAVLEVSDGGPGIGPADRERVFDRFYRADPSRTRASGGSGLGLAIVAGIVEAHGGSVAVVDGAVDGVVDGLAGATFQVRLPLRVVSRRPERQPATRRGPHVTGCGTRTSP
ncbi:MAG: ATP-binding protein [Frankiales bacterium]|nr:ATP-binding protein [Frankiales bacterium]